MPRRNGQVFAGTGRRIIASSKFNSSGGGSGGGSGGNRSNDPRDRDLFEFFELEYTTEFSNLNTGNFELEYTASVGSIANTESFELEYTASVGSIANTESFELKYDFVNVNVTIT